MSKSLKQILLFLGLVIVMQLLSTPFQSIGEYTYQVIKSNLETMGMEINAKEARFSLPVKLLIPYSEIKIKDNRGSSRYVILESTNLALSIFDLIKLKRTLMLSTSLYQGSVNIDLSQGLFYPNSLLMNAVMDNTDIATLFADKRFAGQLSTNIKSDFPIIDGQIDYKDNLDCKIKIRNGSYLGGDNISGLMILPAANDIKLDLEIKGNKAKYKLERISFISSLGTVAGKAEVELGTDPRFPKTLDVDVEIDLTDQGASFFSEYLKLTSKTQVQGPHKKWRLKAQKAQNELFPRVQSEAL